MTETTNSVAPTGRCFCGCGKKIGYGRFFATGHDKMAEAAFLAKHHDGSIAQMLVAHGYGPEEETSVTRAAVKAGVWKECPKAGCEYRGSDRSVQVHVDRYH